MANSVDSVIFLSDLLESDTISDSDILIIEDKDNTKKITFRNLIKSIIEDNEVESFTRIYSSKKIVDLFTNLEGSVDTKIGSIERSLDNISKTTMNSEQLSLIINDLDAKKLDKTGLNPIIEELENTMKKSDPITSDRLASGSDVDKIHIKHLGRDVLNAITGKAPVQNPSVPSGGWMTEDLASKCITADKLSKDYLFKGSKKNSDLDRLVESGLYVISSDSNKCPHYGYDHSESRLLEVIRYGDDGKYIIQRVYYHEYTSEPRPYFERRGLFSKLATLEFNAHFDVTSKNKIGQNLLGDTYSNRGVLSDSDNLFEVSKDGNYVCESTVKNLPTEDVYIVNIQTYGDRKEYIAKRITTNGVVIYSCYEYPNNANIKIRTDWENESNISKSKFDGERLYIYGDTTLNPGQLSEYKESLGNLLHSKYGWIVENKACDYGDGTVAPYGDSSLTDSCIIGQIDNTTGINEDDDIYVLLVAGSEDYRHGLCNLGKNTDTTQDTFKGAINVAISKILTRVPKAKILLGSPIFRAAAQNPGDGGNGDATMINNKYLSSFATAMKEVAAYNHIPCLDLYNECSINNYNKDVYLISGGEDVTGAGVLLTKEGHALIAEKIHDGFTRFY